MRTPSLKTARRDAAAPFARAGVAAGSRCRRRYRGRFHRCIVGAVIRPPARTARSARGGAAPCGAAAPRASTSASRTWSYTDSSGPSIVRPPSLRGHADMPRRSSAATSASRLVSTSMNTRLRLLRELSDLAGVHDAPALQHDDAVAGALDVGHQVRREQHADAELAVRLPDQRQHLFAPQRDRGPRSARRGTRTRDRAPAPGQLHALLHAGRVAADGAVALLEQPGVAQRVGGAGARRRRRKAAHLRHVRQELGGAHLARQAVVLGHVAEPRAHGDALASAILAQHRRRAGRRLGAVRGRS